MRIEKDIIKAYFQERGWVEFFSPFCPDIKKAGRDFKAKCRFHQEEEGSLSINPDTGIYHCFGCGAHGDAFNFWAAEHNLDIVKDFPQILEGIMQYYKIGSGLREIAAYDYTDTDGTLLYQIVRYEPKDFRARPGVPKDKRVLYDLPKVSKSDIIVIVEGERDTDALTAHGIAATTSPFGANADWLPQYTEALEDKIVILIPDRDPAGEEHMKKISQAIYRVAKRIYWLDLLEGKDVSDCLASMPSMTEQLTDFISRLRRNEPVEDIEGNKYKSFSLRTQQGRNSNTSGAKCFKNNGLDDYNSPLRVTSRNNRNRKSRIRNNPTILGCCNSSKSTPVG
jgi:hypothetical protein